MSEIIKNPNEISDSELDNVSGGTDENSNTPLTDLPGFNTDSGRSFTREELEDIVRKAGLGISQMQSSVSIVNQE